MPDMTEEAIKDYQTCIDGETDEMPGEQGPEQSVYYSMKKTCPSKEHTMTRKHTRFAFFLIGIGVLCAIESYSGISIASKLWPVMPLLFGIGLVGIFVKRKTGGIAFLAFGEYLIGFSGLALYCNFTSWHNIGRFWPLFIGFLGIVFLSIFLAGRKRRLLSFMGSLSVSLSAFFYFVFSIDIRLWWTSFVLLGLSIFISTRIE